MCNFNNIDEEKLKLVFEIKSKYETGKLSLEEANNLLKQKVKILHPYEFAYIEQKLKEVNEDECINENLEILLKLFDGIMEFENLPDDKNHPISMYIRENKELEKIIDSIRDLVQYPVIKNQWDEIYEKLSEYKIHYIRKQNQLYPILEKKGFYRPSETMWVYDDLIKNKIKEIWKLLEENEELFIARQEELINHLEDLKNKEEKILFPTALKLISESEFEDMKIGDTEIGYAFIDSEIIERKEIEEINIDNMFMKDLSQLLNKYSIKSDNEELNVATGKLSLEQINLIFRNMPVDLSFVDENEVVKFYTDTKHRVFPRSKNVIGRNVKNCHPKKSVHIVTEIIEKFKSGEKDTAEFWIDMGKKFIYIHYTAIRDKDNNFKGILEMMQDVTHIRNLVGSKTLLDW